MHDVLGRRVRAAVGLWASEPSSVAGSVESDCHVAGRPERKQSLANHVLLVLLVPFRVRKAAWQRAWSAAEVNSGGPVDSRRSPESEPIIASGDRIPTIADGFASHNLPCLLVNVWHQGDSRSGEVVEDRRQVPRSQKKQK